MKGIVWKLFIPVLLAMASLIFVSLLLLVNFSSRVSQNMQQLVPQLYEEAKDVFLQSGKNDLIKWLDENKSIDGLRIFIVDNREKDLLSRVLPPPNELIKGMNRNFREGVRNRGKRRTGRYPFLRDNSETYRFILARPAGGVLGLLKSQKTFLPILLSMLLLSALLSALIARKISQPIQELRKGVQRISSGDLQAKISPDLSLRKDELGALANDFDEMTAKLKSLLSTQQTLLRDISHELRSPLARLQVALGLAEKRSGGEVRLELQRIEKESNTLNMMIGEILSLVRLNNFSIDSSELNFEELDLVKLFEPLVNNARYEGQERSIECELFGPKVLPIKAVSQLLASAFENILRNAIKHSVPNSKIICNLEQKDTQVILSISDSGGGVPENELDKIFDTFYRIGTVRDHNKGTGGIGLAIAKQAVELHGGTIRAENLEKGLKITIVLPI